MEQTFDQKMDDRWIELFSDKEKHPFAIGKYYFENDKHNYIAKETGTDKIVFNRSKSWASFDEFKSFMSDKLKEEMEKTNE